MNLENDLKEIIIAQGRTILELLRKIDVMTERLEQLQIFKDSKEIPF